MWNAIGAVTSGFGLVAFVIAAIVHLRLRAIRERSAVIRDAKGDPRQAELVQAALEAYSVSTDGLTKQQRYDLLREQLRQRSERFRILAVSAAVTGLVGIVLGAYLLYQPPTNGSPPDVDEKHVPWTLRGNVENLERDVEATIVVGGCSAPIATHDGSFALEILERCDQPDAVALGIQVRGFQTQWHEEPRAALREGPVRLKWEAESVALSGTVEDEDGRPVTGAVVRLPGCSALGRELTGPDGGFDFGVLPARCRKLQELSVQRSEQSAVYKGRLDANGALVIPVLAAVVRRIEPISSQIWTLTLENLADDGAIAFRCGDALWFPRRPTGTPAVGQLFVPPRADTPKKGDEIKLEPLAANALGSELPRFIRLPLKDLYRLREIAPNSSAIDRELRRRSRRKADAAMQRALAGGEVRCRRLREAKSASLKLRGLNPTAGDRDWMANVSRRVETYQDSWGC